MLTQISPKEEPNMSYLVNFSKLERNKEIFLSVQTQTEQPLFKSLPNQTQQMEPSENDKFSNIAKIYLTKRDSLIVEIEPLGPSAISLGKGLKTSKNVVYDWKFAEKLSFQFRKTKYEFEIFDELNSKHLKRVKFQSPSKKTKSKALNQINSSEAKKTILNQRKLSHADSLNQDLMTTNPQRIRKMSIRKDQENQKISTFLVNENDQKAFQNPEPTKIQDDVLEEDLNKEKLTDMLNPISLFSSAEKLARVQLQNIRYVVCFSNLSTLIYDFSKFRIKHRIFRLFM